MNKTYILNFVLWTLGWFLIGMLFASVAHANYEEASAEVVVEDISCTPTPTVTPANTPTPTDGPTSTPQPTATPTPTAGASIQLPAAPPNTSLRQL